MKIENECGVFTIGEAGLLTGFLPSESNIVDAEARVFRQLVFPDEIRAIPEIVDDFVFRELTILDRIAFPSRLEELGSYAFDNRLIGIFCWSRLPDVVLPETLRVLGNFAFGKSEIRSIRLNNYAYQYGRQFKGAHIGTWYLSKDAPKDPYIMDLMRFNDQRYDSIVEY